MILFLSVVIFGCKTKPVEKTLDSFYFLNIYDFEELYISTDLSFSNLTLMKKENNYFSYKSESIPESFLVTDKKTYRLISNYSNESPVYYDGWNQLEFLNQKFNYVYFINEGFYQDITLHYDNNSYQMYPIDSIRYIGLISEDVSNYYYSYTDGENNITSSNLEFNSLNVEYYSDSLHPFNSYEVPNYRNDNTDVNRIFCMVPDNWDDCYYYTWTYTNNELINNGDWPGKPMNKINNKYYYIDVDKKFENIIFNGGKNNSSQTADLKISSALEYNMPLYDIDNICFKELSFNNLSSATKDIYLKKSDLLVNPSVLVLDVKYPMELISDDVYHAKIPANVSEVAFCDDTHYTTYYSLNDDLNLFNGYHFEEFTFESNVINFEKDDIKYYNDLFNSENKVTISIDISDDELTKMQKDYEKFSSMGSKSPIYRMCDLTICINNNSYIIKQVGIRMKGNTSRTSFYGDEGIYNMIHFKLSFKQTFDDEDEYDEPLVWESKDERKARKNRTFGTMESIELKWNKNYDGTHIKTKFASDFFSEFDILSQKVTLSQVKITNKGVLSNLGIYELAEPVDENFLEKRLDEKDLGGDLYKFGWTNKGATFTTDTLDSIGVEDELNGKFYIYDLKTNKKKSDHHDLINFINGISSDDDVANYVDIDYFLRFMAACYITGNPDDFRNNYNNGYIYFLKSTSKAIFIPYDLDRTFGVTKDFNPNGDAMTSVDPYTTKSVIGDQINPLILKTVCYGASQEYLNKYTAYLKEMIDSSYLSETNFNRIFNNYKSLYGNCYLPTIESIKNKAIGFSLSDDNMSFSDYIKKIRKNISNL